MKELTVEEAEAALAKAFEAKKAAETAKEAAMREVRRVHDPLVSAATSDYGLAKQALAEAQSRAAKPHEWEGRKVFKLETVYRGSTWRPTAEKRPVEGVVFTYRHGDDLGPGNTYRRPNIGDPWVRLLKKDGTPGKKTARLFDCAGKPDGWQLADAPSA